MPGNSLVKRKKLPESGSVKARNNAVQQRYQHAFLAARRITGLSV
jgi:hypothetical protein